MEDHYEISETILHHFIRVFSGGAAPFPDTTPDSGKRLRSGSDACGALHEILKLDQVKETADFLIEIMPVMFIPAAVGLLDSWSALQPIWFPVVVITILTTVIVMAATGRVTQHMIRRNHHHKTKGADKQ